ncbi:10085_t:CDS:2, partial [Entrophospora sp. SA101]
TFKEHPKILDVDFGGGKNDVGRIELWAQMAKIMAEIESLFTYENDYSIWDELENLELYKYRDVQCILDFKWNKFGFKYYYGVWMIHMAFLSCFVAPQSDKLPNEARMLLIVIAIILGVFHLYFEIRQFSYNPKKYIRDISNLFDFTIDEAVINDGKQPDNKTNKFTLVSSSILAIFNMLTDDPYLAILYAAVTLIFIVCMAVFNGLLSNVIEKIDRKDEFWAQRARIIAEIEMYYLHAEQRCRKDWFPDILPYNVSIDEIRKGITEIDNSNEDPKPFIPDELRKFVGIPKPRKPVNIRTEMERMENDIKEIKDELRNTNNKIKDDLEKILEKKMNEDKEELLQQMKILMDEVKKAQLKH